MYFIQNTSAKAFDVDKYRKLKGSSMVEVLVAVVILSFGALGAAAMQISSKKANYEAQQRFVASYLANDIIEKMRNNPGALGTYAGANLGGESISSEPETNCSDNNTCNSTQLALYDRWLWEQALNGAAVKIGTENTAGLVQPAGCITNNAGRIQVIVSWWGAEKTTDAGEGERGVEACGTASNNRRQLAINTFIF